MSDIYLKKRIKNNWKMILVVSVLILIAAFGIYKFSRSNYNNMHKMSNTLNVTFDYKGETLKGFLFVSYWVEVDPKIEKEMSEKEFNHYLNKNAVIKLDKIENELVNTIQNYTIEELKEKGYTDEKYIMSRDKTQNMDSDPVLEKLIKNENFKLDFPYEIKNTYFVYMTSL